MQVVVGVSAGEREKEGRKMCLLCPSLVLSQSLSPDSVSS